MPAADPAPLTATVTPIATLHDPMAWVWQGRGFDTAVVERDGHVTTVTLPFQAQPLRVTAIANSGPSRFPGLSLDGEGGVIDVAPYSRFSVTDAVRFSYVASGPGGTKLVVTDGGLSPTSVSVGDRIYLETPEIAGNTTRYGGELKVVRGDITRGIVVMMVSIGDRGQSAQAQDLGSMLGKILRFSDDRLPFIPVDNPYPDTPGVQPLLWSYGHREVTALPESAGGLSFDSGAGPGGSDELNYVRPGCNYGWPSMTATSVAPLFAWATPIRPRDMVVWNNNVLIGADNYSGLIRLTWNGTNFSEVQRIPLPAPIRKLRIYRSTLYGLENGTNGRMIEIALQ
ncbi:MAG TPA: PQQ-dependent sugar dehydrogenase [Sphingomonas sp.]|nr:PQQ-dependent sugar dehydrogenase [Sphingomonas sp.]